jgi:Putative zinc-finger
MSSNLPMNPPNHLDEVTGLLYVEGQLEAAAAREVVAHLEQCSSCRLLLDTLKRESLLLRQALVEEDEPLPARLTVPRMSEGLTWGWLLAFGLGAAGLYTFWNVYISPWIDNLQQSGFGGQFMFTWLVFNGASWKGWDAMLQFIIFASLIVLGAVLLFLFRRNLRRLSSFSIFLAALLLLAIAHPPSARAAEFVKQNGSYDVHEGQTVNKDLFVFAESVRVAGTVNGDLYCFCNTLTIESGGHVTGDVIAFAHAVRVIGKVDGNLRAFTGNGTIEGEVGRNVLGFVGFCQTTPGSHVAGSATLFVGDLELDGRLGRDLAAFIGAGSINAPIGGDVMLRQHENQNEHGGHYGPPSDRETIQVGSQADIKGGFSYKGPFKPDISPQAHLGSAPQIQIITEPPWYNRPMNYWYNAMIWGTGFLVGLVFIALAPGFVQEATRQAGRIGAPLGLGLVAFIVMPIAGILACITVVGLGLGVTMIFLWLFFVFFGQVIAAMWIGDAILGEGVGTWALVGRMALGLFLIRLGALLPFVGVWVRFLACVLGLGAVVLIIYRRFQPPAAPRQTAPLPAAPAAA